MTSSVQNNPSNNEWLCSQTRGDRIEFQWTIEKFRQLPHKNSDGFYSPVFPPHNNDNEQWKLQIFPHGETREDSGWISVFLLSASDKMHEIKIKCEITIFQLNEALGTIEFTCKFDETKDYGEPKLVNRAKLSRKDDFDDAITINCKIEILGTYITSSEKKISETAVPFEARENQLSVDLQLLYENPILTDFTIISGDKKFPVHKIILASRCPVFAAMFDQKKSNENIKNELKIEDIETDVVEGFLEFIYTDDVTEIGELAEGLLAAAEQYELGDLKNLCEINLYKTLDENNAAELLALADLHDARQLKKYVMQYIADHAEDVVKSEAFDSVDMPLELSKEIIRALTLPKSENSAN